MYWSLHHIGEFPDLAALACVVNQRHALGHVAAVIELEPARVFANRAEYRMGPLGELCHILHENGLAELDVIESPMEGAAGIEYPGVYYVEDSVWDVNQFFYEVVMAHETAHQWFYSVIGNNTKR